MANTLMFEVGVSNSVKDLDKLKTELDGFIKHYTKDTAIKLRIEIDNLTTITTALSKIGDTPQLRNLRQEIEALNREFSKMAVGAGGMGDFGVRKMNQDVEDLKQKWDSAIRTLGRYNEELAIARRNRDSTTNFTDRQGYSEQINKLKDNIKVQQEVVNNAKTAYDNAVKNAGSLVEVNTRAEASFREVKKSIDEMKTSLNGTNVTVNLGKDFSKWAQEVQNVTASVRELVEQLQKMHNASTTALQATQQLSQAEQKGTPQGGLFDPQKFNTLQEAIDKIISEINRLQQAFTKLGENSSLSNLSTTINGLAVTLTSLSNAVKFTGSADEIAAYEAKVKSLKDTIAQLEAQAKQVSVSVANATKGISTQAEKKGSESVLADNLQKLKSRISEVTTEFNRLNESYGQARTMGMPVNMDIEQRLDLLRRYIQTMQQLETAAKNTTNATKVEQEIREALSKSKAFSFQFFEGNQLFSKENTRFFNKKEIDAYIKTIEEFVKANGHMAQTSGSARSASANLTQMSEAMRESAERANQMGHSFANTVAGMQNFARNVETARLAYDKTLRGISELESRISAGQKANMDKESLDFMNGLKQRAQQWADILRKLLGENMQGNPMYREFLSMNGNILTSPQVGNMFQSLLGADWKILMKDIGETFNMLMKFSGFSKSLTLDNSTLTNWLKGEEAVRRLDNALKDLNKQWSATNNEAKTPDLTARYEAQKRAIESLIAQIKGAMTEADRMSNRNGLADLLGVGFKNAVGYDNTRLIQDMRVASKNATKADAEYMKEVEKFTEQSKKAYAQAEKEKEKAAQERAKAVAAAEKTVQSEITKTESLQKKIAQSITRGEAAGRDMSGLKAQNAALEQQLRLMEALKNSIGRGRIDPNSDIIGKRIKDTQVLREDTELLRKSEEKLNQAREQANRRNDNAAIKQLQDEEKSVKQAWNRYEELKQKISEVEALRSRAQELKMDTTSINQTISDLRMLKQIMSDIIANGGKTTLSYGRAGAGLLEKDFWATQGKSTNMLANKNIAAFNKELSETERQSTKADANIRKLGMAFNELKGYMKANGGSEEMRRLQAEIQGAIRKMRQLMNAGNFAGAVNVYERMAGSLRQAATATKEFENSQHSLSSTISHTNSNLQGQSQILSDLKSMATQYLSVWGAQSFINNIIELGGQLEQQRLSIGAILQDTAQANHLFSQIKDLAIKSPFGVQQLDAMTKQLSAYGFQYSELYEWTKRLADISAATGTSVDRLALALGHVRSEGALSGYTLRQFSMGNIPLLQKLSENLGKTKQEIRKMTRNKEIGYEDVLNVLKQLTDEGGMFFEAQETMSQALNAKFKNLRDSFQIMYSEMAEGAPGDFLKGLATTLTDLSRQWQILLPMVGAAGAMWAMNKASAALVNVELAKMDTLTNANTLASSKYSVAQLRQIANWEKMPHAMVRARLALQGFRTSLLSLGKMVFSWPTAIFAAIEALTYMWAKQSRESEKAKEMTEVLTNTALESQKNLAKQLSNIGPYEEGMSDSAMKTGIESMTEAIKNYGVNAQSVLGTVFGKDAEGRVMSLAEKYQYLREELEKTEKVYKEMQRTSGGIEFGVEFTDGGWLDDDVQTDLTNYAEAVKEYEDAFVSMTANYSTAVNNALEQVKKASPEFKRIADGLSSDAERVKWLYENQGEYGGLYNMFKGALHREDPNAGGGVLGTQLGDNLRSAEQEAMKELDQFLKGTEEWFKKFGYDFTENGKNLSEVQVGNLLRQSKEWLEKHPEWQNIYDVIWDKLNKRWGLPIVPDVTEIEEELPQWLADLQKELDKTGIKLTANMSMEQVVDEMKKAYDKAQTTINKLGPIALHAKINIQGMSDTDIEKYGDPTSFLYNPEMYQWMKELKKANDTKNIVDTVAKKRGLRLEGMKKDGTHKAEKQNQEAAKAVRERVRVIKEAADAFQYWREKVGDKGAWEHVQREFGDVLRKIDITATNIEDVRAHLKKIPQMKEYKAITDKKVKTEIDKEIAKDNDQFIRKDFERDTEQFLSKTQLELDNLTRVWDTFNKVREATGNVELAKQISGAEYQAGQTRNLADALKKNIEEGFADIGSVGIPFDISLDDKKIENRIKEIVPKESEDKIKGLVEQYKKWRDLQRDVLKSDIDVFGKLIGSVVDYDSQLEKINDEYDKQKDSLDEAKKSGAISPADYEKALSILDTNADTKRWKASQSYIDLMNKSLAMTRDEIDAAAKTQEEMLNKNLEAGLITIQQYSEEMEKLRNIQREYNRETTGIYRSAFTAYMAKGTEGLSEYYKRQSRKYNELYAKSTDKNSSEAQGYLKKAQRYDDMSDKQIKLADDYDKMAGALNKMKAAVDMATMVLEAFGKEDDTLSAFGDMFGGISQGASTGSAFGTYGAIFGGVLGGMLGLAAHTEKDTQKVVEAIQDNIKALEANTSMIESNRNRTLGYDAGDLRRQMLKMQDNKIANGDYTVNIRMFDMTTENPVGEALKKYYSDNANKSGYQQQLETLKQMKIQYENLYMTEESKKNASESALEEYKQKITELEDQILYFTEDLARELWDIDFKSWASQISDALWTAFENGEDAMEAFHDAANDIIADVAKKMMNIHFIEPAFKALETQLFGGLDSNGNVVKGAAYDEATGKWNEDETLRILGKFFGEDGEFAKVINSAESFYRMAEQVSGSDFKGDKSSSSTSNTIKNITEQTADLLASYVSAIRLDVSVNRAAIAQYFPLFYQALTSHNSSLTNIENHTAAIMRSNEAIASHVADLQSDIRGLKNKAWKMPIA